jgi:hypothetical protein
MHIARQFLPAVVFSVLIARSPVLAQEVPPLAEARSILQEASALVPEVEEAQRASLANNISLEQVKAGDTAGALATIQLLPAGPVRDGALCGSSSALAAQGNWRMAIQNIESLSQGRGNSVAFLSVADRLAQRRDFEDAIIVARMILDTPDTSRFADTMMLVYAQQFKSGDTGGAVRTLNEALDAVEGIERRPDTPDSFIAARYAGLIELANAGGRDAASPILERLYQMVELEKDPAKKTQIRGRVASSQAVAGDFAGARRVAYQLPPGEVRDQALLGIASAQARQGDPAGARLMASEVSPKGWTNLALQDLGLALAAGGDHLEALSTIEKVQGAETLATSLGQLALAEAEKQGYWAMVAAQLTLETYQSAKAASSFPLQLVAVTRGVLWDFAGAIQIVNQLTTRDRQWPLWNLTENLVDAGRKDEALALARAQEDPYPRAYALLGTAAQMLLQIDNAHKKAAGR